jgi:hypothetical protein
VVFNFETMSFRIIFLFLFPVSIFAQDSYFEKIYGTAGDDISRSVKQLASGSIFVLGNSSSGTIGMEDISVTKLDNDGNELWTIYYGTVNTENAFFLNITADGNFVFVAESETASNNLDILMYKIDTAGGIIWNKSYVSPVNETPRYIEQTNDGGYILCGTQNDLVGFNDILVVKLDSNGDYIWHTTYGRDDNEYSDMIHQIGTDYILTADTKSYGAGGYDVILYRLDSLGNEIWSQTYGDTLQNGCQGLLVVSDGNFLSYGETEIYPASPYDFYLEKVDTNGGSIWRYLYGGAGSDAIFSVKEDTDGGFICTGYSNSYNGLAPIDLVIMKVDSNGIFQWKQTYGSPGIDVGYEIIKATDNNGFIITGQTYTTSTEYYLLKLDQNGLIIDVPSAENEIFVSEAYPNPASTEVWIRYNLIADKNPVLALYDVFGKKIREEKIQTSPGMIKIDVSQMNSGIYFYAVKTEGRMSSVKKLIVTSK